MTNIHDTWKLKAQSSNVSFHETWQKRRSSLSFELSKMSPQVGLAVHTSASEVYERYVHLYQSCVRAVKMYRSTYVYM